MSVRENVNYCSRRRYKSKNQNYYRDNIGENRNARLEGEICSNVASQLVTPTAYQYNIKDDKCKYSAFHSSKSQQQSRKVDTNVFKVVCSTEEKAMDDGETVNYCRRRYCKSKYQNYSRDFVHENKGDGYKKLGWYIGSSTDMLHHIKCCISSKEEALYKNAINLPSENKENELSSIGERISTLFDNKLYSDVLLNVNEKKYFGHSFILSLASPVFKATFYSELNSERKDSYDVIDVSESGFLNLLRFIYTDNTPQPDNLSEFLETLYAARVFLVSSLVNICIQKCIEVLNIQNLCQILDTAYCLDLDTLTDTCLQLYIMQQEQVLTSDSFLSAKTDTVMFLFGKAIENGMKKEFNFYLMKWAINETKRRGLSTFEVAKVLKPFFAMNLSASEDTH